MIILTEENKLQIKEHSLSEAPNECCGIFVENVGIIKLNNKSKKPQESFLIDFNTLKRAEKYGKIEGFYHSHTEDDFSEIDKLISEKRMLSSVVYKIKEDSFSVYNPIGLEIPYVGRQFILGIFDCITLMQDYYLRQRNILIKDFNHRCRYIENYEGEPENYRNNTDFINHLLNNGFEVVSDLREDDLLVSRFGRVLAPSHCMIYLGNNKILHQLYNRPSIIEHYSNSLKRSTAEVLRHWSLR